MVKLKEQNIVDFDQQSNKVRLVKERGDDRRQQQQPIDVNDDQRVALRRQHDIQKQSNELELLRQENERLQERQRKLMVSKPELLLYYGALFLSVNIIFGWMAFLVSYIQ
ncbi:MAG: hypothetical protein CMF60_02520 [Magnetococcales bacterium]|nr:hypothetical protein [Magnetococcales bacterium]|tara:strand:- start:11577 stop:11906 length:330 start_codon:yes stop_codon:yes gene_type:complete